jgi:hypothetical protein
MNTVQLREELGELINHCTNENFEKGYDPISDIIDNSESINSWNEKLEIEKQRIEQEEWRIACEEYEFQRLCEFEDYLERNYPGETLEEKYFEYLKEVIDDSEYLETIPEIDDENEAENNINDVFKLEI